MTSSTHTAAAPALGYAAQLNHGLLSLLELAFCEPGSLTLELLDDVETLTGRERNLEQIKNKPGTARELSDSSADLWLTLDNWIVAWVQCSAEETLRFSLVTTQTAAPGSALSLLRAPPAPREVERAAELLSQAADKSSAKTTAEARERWKALPLGEQHALLRAVQVRDGATDASDLHDRLIAVDKLRSAVADDRVRALVDILLGWWARRALLHLHRVAGQQDDRITTEELEQVVHEARRTLADDRLPIWETFKPDEHRVESDDDTYLRQLRLVAAPERRLNRAQTNYRRAYAHRSRWGRLGLITDAELERYEDGLLEEWELHRDELAATPCEGDDAECQRGMDLLTRAELHVQLPLRGLYDRFIVRGSYHSLADRRALGWHPRWEQLLDTEDERQ